MGGGTDGSGVKQVRNCINWRHASYNNEALRPLQLTRLHAKHGLLVKLLLSVVNVLHARHLGKPGSELVGQVGDGLCDALCHLQGGRPSDTLSRWAGTVQLALTTTSGSNYKCTERCMKCTLCSRQECVEQLAWLPG